MDKKFVLITLTNSILFVISFSVIILTSLLIVQIITIVVTLLLTILFTKLILIKYKDNIIEETFFITNLTHSMRNPLAKISGNAQLIQMKTTSKEADNILVEVEELDKMITDLLEHSITIENLQNQSVYNISEQLQNECAKYKNISMNKKFICNIDNEIMCLTNELTMKTLVSTLLENAFKYSMSEVSFIATNETITISNDTDLPSGNYNHLFQRFKRANNNKTGFGVGLSLVKIIVEQTGRTINAEVIDGYMHMIISK